MHVREKQLNSNLSNGVKVDYFTLSIGEYTKVTTSKVTHTTLASRKFSDYEYLNFELIVGNLIRASFSLPRRRFGTYSAELTYVDSTKTQYWVNVAWASDTSYIVQGSSNIPSNAYVCITGMVALL